MRFMFIQTLSDRLGQTDRMCECVYYVYDCMCVYMSMSMCMYIQCSVYLRMCMCM